jgi:hypothetical protein
MKIRIKRSLKENIFGKDYEKIGQGAFATIYRSKSDPDKVMVVAKGDTSRDIIMSIKEKNRYLPEYENMSQYSDLQKNQKAYKTKYYPALDDYSTAFPEALELKTGLVNSKLTHKGIKSEMEKGNRLSDTLSQMSKIPKDLTMAIKLIEDAIAKTDYDFMWDFGMKNFAMTGDPRYETQLILLDPLSPGAAALDAPSITYEQLEDLMNNGISI